MSRPQRIEGYAIISREGMICTADGTMPAALKVEADQRFFHAGLARADAVANGRHSNEGGPHAAARRRLVLTRRVTALATDPENPMAVLWNPAAVQFDDAWERLAVDGVLAVVGGTDVFGLFLGIGFDAFFLTRVPAPVPHGRPVFPAVPGMSPEAVLAGYGLTIQSPHVLDERLNVTVTEWRRG
jgi:dihydrofolate reductase